MTTKELNHLKMLSESDFESACVWAENNIGSLKDFFETWSKNCGASKQVFIGHTIKMIVEE